jgi:hypothetical protein
MAWVMPGALAACHHPSFTSCRPEIRMSRHPLFLLVLPIGFLAGCGGGGGGDTAVRITADNAESVARSVLSAIGGLDRRAAFVADAFWRPFWESPPDPLGAFEPTPDELLWRTPGEVACPDGGTATLEAAAPVPDTPAAGDRYTRRFSDCALTFPLFPSGSVTMTYGGTIEYVVTSFSGTYPQDFVLSAEVDASGLVTTAGGVASTEEGAFGLVAGDFFEPRTLVADTLRIVADARELYRWTDVSVSSTSSGAVVEGQLNAASLGGRVDVTTPVPWTTGGPVALPGEILVAGAGSTLRIRWAGPLLLALDVDANADGTTDQTVDVLLGVPRP